MNYIKKFLTNTAFAAILFAMSCIGGETYYNVKSPRPFTGETVLAVDKNGNYYRCDTDKVQPDEVHLGGYIVNSRYCEPGIFPAFSPVNEGTLPSVTPPPTSPPIGTTTPTSIPLPTACGANVTVNDDFSQRIHIRRDGLNEALEDLGLCQKKFLLLVQDIPGFEFPVDVPEFGPAFYGATTVFRTPGRESDIGVQINVVHQIWSPSDGYRCGEYQVDWESNYNCTVLHELKHVNQELYSEGGYMATEEQEREAEEYAVQNFQFIKVIEAEELACSSRVVILDESQRISINEEGLNTIAQDLGINPGCLHIKLEDIDHTLWPTFVGGSYIDSLSRDVWLLTFKIPSSEYFERGCVNCCPFPYPPVHYYPEIINCSVVGTLRGLWHEINDPEEEAYSGNARNRDIDQYILQKRGIMVISVD